MLEEEEEERLKKEYYRETKKNSLRDIFVCLIYKYIYIFRERNEIYIYIDGLCTQTS